MTPYYEHGGITIYHGNCQEIVPYIQADVLVTDPPYGMSYRSGWSGASVMGDGNTSVRDTVLDEWAPRPAIVFGRWNIVRPGRVRARLIWDKGDWPGMGDLSFPWGPSDEEVYVIGDGWIGKREGTIIHGKRLGGSGDHPAQKPVGLLRGLLKKCPPGIVLDPFMGSGTTLVAAKELGRCVIGIEIEEKYCEIAAKRLAQEVMAL